MENCIVYNSWDNNFKAPFGALNITQSAKITVKANENFDINKVELILDKEDENLNIETIRKIELKLDENRTDGVFYTGEILPLEEQGI